MPALSCIVALKASKHESEKFFRLQTSLATRPRKVTFPIRLQTPTATTMMTVLWLASGIQIREGYKPKPVFSTLPMFSFPSVLFLLKETTRCRITPPPLIDAQLAIESPRATQLTASYTSTSAKETRMASFVLHRTLRDVRRDTRQKYAQRPVFCARKLQRRCAYA